MSTCMGRMIQRERERIGKIFSDLSKDVLLKEFFRKLKEEAEEEMLQDLAKLNVSSSRVGR